MSACRGARGAAGAGAAWLGTEMIFPRHPRLMIVVGVILVAAAAAVGLMARAGRPALDEKTVARVTPGMSAGEVEAVLGPATEVRRGTAAVTGAAGDPASRPETERRVWERDGKVVTVTFTGGRVAEVEMK